MTTDSTLTNPTGPKATGTRPVGRRSTSRMATFAAALTGAVLVGTLAFGSVASAAGPADGSGSSTRQRPAAEKICADQDGAVAKMADAKAKVEARITELTAKRDAAAAAGKTHAVDRLDRRINRLQRLLDRIEQRIAQFPTWVAEHCA